MYHTAANRPVIRRPFATLLPLTMGIVATSIVTQVAREQGDAGAWAGALVKVTELIAVQASLQRILVNKW